MDPDLTDGMPVQETGIRFVGMTQIKCEPSFLYETAHRKTRADVGQLMSAGRSPAAICYAFRYVLLEGVLGCSTDSPPMPSET